eukprot:2369846-Rhodomonas_salina.1
MLPKCARVFARARVRLKPLARPKPGAGWRRASKDGGAPACAQESNLWPRCAGAGATHRGWAS